VPWYTKLESSRIVDYERCACSWSRFLGSQPAGVYRPTLFKLLTH